MNLEPTKREVVLPPHVYFGSKGPGDTVLLDTETIKYLEKQQRQAIVAVLTDAEGNKTLEAPRPPRDPLNRHHAI